LGLIVAGGYVVVLTRAREDGKEERLARLTAERIENSGQDALNPTAKTPSNHTPSSGQIMCFPTETINRVIEKFKAEFRTFPASYEVPRVRV
jgi:hypothetical protein